MKINQQKLQVPYLQPDLVTVDTFISYCRDSGVSTDEAELEYLHKEGLLIPAIRVLMGVVEYRRILAVFNGLEEWRYVYGEDLDKFRPKELDPRKYYGSGALVQSVPGLGEVRGFHFGNDGWLDWYLERKMVRYPAKDGYIAWVNFGEPDKNGQMFGDDPKQFEQVSRLMYAKHQIYPLRLIKAQRIDVPQKRHVFKIPKGHPRAGEFVLSDYADQLSDEALQQELVKWNEFFSFLIDIRKLRLDKHREINDAYMLSMRQNSNDHKEATRYARSVGALYDAKVKVRAKEIANGHHSSIQTIESWRHKLLGYGSFGINDQSRVFRNYVASLDNSLLNRSEDVYDTVNVISWFIELLGGRGLNAKQLILHSMGEVCKYCGREFQPTRSTQITCGSLGCKQKQRNEHKRDSRKLAKARRATSR